MVQKKQALHLKRWDNSKLSYQEQDHNFLSHLFPK